MLSLSLKKIAFQRDGLTLIRGDSTKILPELEAECAAAVITDPPYGTTSAEWDCGGTAWLPHALTLVAARGPVVVFSAGKFTAELLAQHRESFRYKLVWDRQGQATGHLDAKRRPLRGHEDIVILARQLPRYYPQRTSGHARIRIRTQLGTSRIYGAQKQKPAYDSTERYPTDVLRFPRPSHHGRLHPTQKPVDLLRWLIRSYTQPGDLVIDCFAGSGSTGVACALEGRRFLGIERDPHFCRVAARRLQDLAVQFRR